MPWLQRRCSDSRHRLPKCCWEACTPWPWRDFFIAAPASARAAPDKTGRRRGNNKPCTGSLSWCRNRCGGRRRADPADGRPGADRGRDGVALAFAGGRRHGVASLVRFSGGLRPAHRLWNGVPGRWRLSPRLVGTAYAIESSWSARDPGCVRGLGSGQQSHAQGLAGGPAADCRAKRVVGGSCQSCARCRSRRVDAGHFDGTCGSTCGLAGLWREPCAVHCGSPASRSGENRRLFFDGALYRRSGGGHIPPRTRDGSTIGGRWVDGTGGLAACDRAARS